MRTVHVQGQIQQVTGKCLLECHNGKFEYFVKNKDTASRRLKFES